MRGTGPGQLVLGLVNWSRPAGRNLTGHRAGAKWGAALLRYRLKAAMTLDEFMETLGSMLDEIPEPLLADLNGGVIAEAGAKRSEEHPELFTLGEYLHDPFLGRMVVLYYGSFAYLFGSSRGRWIEEMRRTLRHELRHHVEDRAGLRDLEREDREAIRRFLEGVDEGE